MFHLKGIKKSIKENKGALTVEAAISLPLFICVFLSIAFFMRVAYIHNNVQYAINGAANELSTYSYLYSISGLQALNDEISGKAGEYGESASDHMTGVLEAFDALGSSFQGINRKNIDVDDFKNLFEDGSKAVENVASVLSAVKDNPQKEFISVAALFAGAGYEKIKNELSAPMVRFFMRKYVNESIFNSKGGPGVYISVNEGENPFQAFKFNNRIFADGKTIDIVVSYRIKTVLPINIIPEIHMKQRAIVRGWMSGDGEITSVSEWAKEDEEDIEDDAEDDGDGEDDSDKEDDEEEEEEGSIWDLGNFEYGSYISKKELEKYQSENPENAYKVRSINLYAKTYQDLRKAKSSIRGTINDFHLKTKDNGGINSRILIVVVPEGSLTEEAKKMFSELKEEAAKKEPPVTIIEKEGYGKPTGH
ncbi:TadE/TadG family type IV pilus assembly protein [Acetivibrio saccincola]|jgi:hypothetical protein|uniref:TadE-like domain-containing protein n=1 Tax=Acetivibrio saccincola TaxID=1677857 RepID=A0A2S8RB93_9FIRM|nr:TadE/TadG family type IV pilus assembly protein [Acetivibrio saccincola]NLW25933.1 pilus assembly protein [Acetivibrio saccincola]PQQ67060.1 hypothetical protein B9R14_10125 [Acetivibrio saccincola]HOA97279.1 pilus assembly protein [Acetivibrio saccincola]HQD29740.1 pilus assembly protein [Acetivibrio saccincola]